MEGYCDYCGEGYYAKVCEECGAKMRLCGCEPCRRVCDECDTTWMDREDALGFLSEARDELREVTRQRDDLLAAAEDALEGLKTAIEQAKRA